MGWYRQTAIAAALTFTALFALSPVQVLFTYVVLGQAHFLLTYLYQARTGKITIAYLCAYAVVLALLAYLDLTGHLGTRYSFGPLVIATALIFVVHFLLDEIRLLDGRITGTAIFALLPLLLSVGALLSQYFFAADFIALAVVLAVISAGIYVVTCRSFRELWPVLPGLAAAAIVIAHVAISPEKILGAIILFHYMRWYLHYGSRLWGGGEFIPYASRILIVNAAMALLFAYWWRYPATSYAAVLNYLFLPKYFYIWTILHVTSSVQWRDCRALFSFARVMG